MTKKHEFKTKIEVYDYLENENNAIRDMLKQKTYTLNNIERLIELNYLLIQVLQWNPNKNKDKIIYCLKGLIKWTEILATKFEQFKAAITDKIHIALATGVDCFSNCSDLHSSSSPARTRIRLTSKQISEKLNDLDKSFVINTVTSTTEELQKNFDECTNMLKKIDRTFIDDNDRILIRELIEILNEIFVDYINEINTWKHRAQIISAVINFIQDHELVKQPPMLH